MQTIRVTTSQNIDIDYELAGLGERIVGSIIDYAIFLVLFFFCMLIGVSLNIQDVSGFVVLVIWVVMYVFYDLLCEIFLNGQSVGKKVMKIRVISADGAQPRVGQYLLRWLFRIADFSVSFGAVALVSAAITTKVQRLGDLVAGTILIKTQPRTNIAHVAFRPADDNHEVTFESASQLSEQDVELINEVINTYMKTGNSMVVFTMAQRVKQHLSVTAPADMNDLRFLQTIMKDYTHTIARQAESF